MSLEQRVEWLENELDLMKARLEEITIAYSCAYNQVTAKLEQIATNQTERKA